MADSGKFNPYLRAGTNILQRIAETVQDVPADISAYIAGGLAISYWLEGRRISLDLDVLFSHRIVLEQGLSARVESAEPVFAERVDFDYNFSDAFSLLQADYPDRAHFLVKYGSLQVYVLAPVDLVLMKVSRFSGRDREDIKALMNENLVDQQELHRLAEDAIKDYIGNTAIIKTSLDIVDSWFYSLENNNSCCPHL